MSSGCCTVGDLLAKAGLDIPCPTHDNPNIDHRDGIAWFEAPIPRKLHRCSPWTTGWIASECVERCACGAFRNPRFGGGWLDKNSRKS